MTGGGDWGAQVSTASACLTRSTLPVSTGSPPSNTCTDLRYWNERERGGHFAAFEQPAIFVEEVRAAFRAFR